MLKAYGDSSDLNNWTNVQFNYFPPNYVNFLKDNLNRYQISEKEKKNVLTSNDNNDFYAFYFSEPLGFNGENVAYVGSKIYNNRNVYNKNGNEDKRDVGLLKAYNVHNYNSDHSLAHIFNAGGTTHNDISQNSKNSFLNHYDNILLIPKNVMSDESYVYIRHVNEKGELLNIANNAEVKISGANEETIITNQISAQTKYIGKTLFQEYYKISLSDKLRVSRSLKYAQNGKIYHYVDSKISYGKTANEALNNNNNSTIKNKNVSFEVGGNTSDQKYTVVTLYYNTEDIPTPTPSGDVNTLTGNGKGQKCIQEYTPTGRTITPYIVSNKAILNNLTYELTKGTNGKVTYQMKSFNAKILDGGKIDDNKNVSTGEGNIFGKANEKYTLFDENETSKDITNLNKKSIKDSLKNFYKNNKDNLLTEKNLKDMLKAEFDSKTSVDDFKNDNNTINAKYIPINRYNGLRTPLMYAHYNTYDILSDGETTIKGNYIEANNKVNIIVYNPLELKEVTVTSSNIIDHTDNSNSTNNVIQKNAQFELNFGTKNSSFYTKINDTSKYLDYYYLIFDMDIILVGDKTYKVKTTINDSEKDKKKGDMISAGSLIKISKGDTTFNAIASSNDKGKDLVSQIQNNVILIGVSNNMPTEELEKIVLKNAILKYVHKMTSIQEQYINTQTSTNKIQFLNYCAENSSDDELHDSSFYQGHHMHSDAYYFAMARTQTTNIGRIYDFKVTDCSDLDYKSVFRTSSSSDNSVNKLTNIQYFSGIKNFDIYYNNELNHLDLRDSINIEGTSAKKILPLGPYKNTNVSYIKAPKMGYRISFDLKTSGYFNDNREIEIKPDYYFISKDGNIINDINLYFKDSDGKYKKFVGSNYTIYFKPNDGYRYISNSVTAGDTKEMSTTLEAINIGSGSGFILNKKMMSLADNKFIQAWYGEFKLPNSTIAVLGDNISNVLKDGYIAVKFNIKCIDNRSQSNEKIISYNKDNNKAEEGKTTNTTQWDYEGYLGFNNCGSAYDQKRDNLSIQLEKSTLMIDSQDTYNLIKGTVVLFDLDNRAANDFD